MNNTFSFLPNSGDRRYSHVSTNLSTCLQRLFTSIYRLPSCGLYNLYPPCILRRTATPIGISTSSSNVTLLSTQTSWPILTLFPATIASPNIESEPASKWSPNVPPMIMTLGPISGSLPNSTRRPHLADGEIFPLSRARSRQLIKPSAAANFWNWNSIIENAGFFYIECQWGINWSHLNLNCAEQHVRVYNQ